jgi:hypothetical protein
MNFGRNLRNDQSVRLALIGDIGVFLLATALGFLSHAGESDPSLNRMAATFVPFLIAWVIVAPWLGAYDPDKFQDPKSLWRPFLAALYAAPLGAFGRSLWLGSPVFPLFVIIMGSVAAGLMALWRALLTRISQRASE